MKRAIAAILRAWANELDPFAGLADGEASIRQRVGGKVIEWPRSTIETIEIGDHRRSERASRTVSMMDEINAMLAERERQLAGAPKLRLVR